MQTVQPDPNGTSPIPDRFTNVVVLGVTARFKAWENNLNAEMVYNARYKEALKDMIGELATRNKPARVKLFGR